MPLLEMACPRQNSAAPTPLISGNPLTTLERRVVELARNDTLQTLEPRRPRGRIAQMIFAPEYVPLPLANERLEAIRKLTVLGWHNGGSPPESATDQALAAGLACKEITAVLAITNRTANAVHPDRKPVR